MKVFISYAKRDVDLAEAIAIRLQQAGQSVFFDRADIPSSSSHDAIIRDQIARVDFLIYLASQESLAPGAYARTELNLFKERFRTPDNRVLTVPLRGQPLSELPVYLRSVSIPSFEGDVAAEVTARALDSLRRLRLRTFRRVLPAVCVAIAVAFIGLAWWKFVYGSPSPDISGIVQFEVVDQEAGELVRQPLTLTIRDGKSGENVTRRYTPIEEIVVTGRSDDLVVVNVTGATGYSFQRDDKEVKDGRRRVSLPRADIKLFRKMIEPRPDKFPSLITPAEYEKIAKPVENSATNVTFVCNNNSSYTVDVLFYRSYPIAAKKKSLDSARDPWNVPVTCKKGSSIISRKGSFGVSTEGYFYVFGSVGGGEAEFLAEGYLFSSLSPMLEISDEKSNPARLLKGRLVDQMN